MVEAGADIHGQPSQGRLQLQRKSVLAAAFYRELQRKQSVENGMAELREHGQSLAPSGTARGLVARGLQQLVVAAQQCLRIVAQRRQVLGRRTAKSFQDGLEKTAQY